MVQVVDTKAGIGAYLGQGFASGVEKGMERQSKLQEMMAKQALKDQYQTKSMFMKMDMMKDWLKEDDSSGSVSKKPVGGISGVLSRGAMPDTVTEESTAPSEPATEESVAPGGVRNITPKKLMAAHLIDKELGDAVDKLYETQETKKRDVEKYAHEDAVRADERERKVVDKWATEADDAQNALEVAGDMRKALATGDIKRFTPYTLANMFFPEKSSLFMNKSEAEFNSLIPTLMAGKKELFGVRLSDADLKIISNALPRLGIDPKANEAIIGVIEKYAERTIGKYQISQQISKGKPLLDYDHSEKTRKVFNELYGKQVRVKYPDGNEHMHTEIDARRLEKSGKGFKRV